MNKNGEREDVNPEGGEGKSKRSRNLTPKGLAYKCDIRREQKIESMGYYPLFLTRNVVAVEEEMGQFNDLFKMLVSA